MNRWTGWGMAVALALVVAPAAHAYDDKETKRESAATATDQGTGSAASTTDQRGNQMPPPTSGIGRGENTGGEPLGTDRQPSADQGTGSSGSTATSERSERSESDDALAKAPSKHDNTDLIKKLWSANVLEIEAAKVAKDNARSEGVKEFADRMEKDHGEMRDALEKLADNRNLKLEEDEALRAHKAHLEQMKEMKGAQLDRHYTSMMVKHHAQSKKDNDAALKRAKQSGDHELAEVLQRAKTTIADHHRVAQQLDKNKGQRMGRRGDAAASTERSAERTGETMERGAERTGEKIERGAEKTGDAIERGAERTGEAAKDATR